MGVFGERLSDDPHDPFLPALGTRASCWKAGEGGHWDLAESELFPRWHHGCISCPELQMMHLSSSKTIICKNKHITSFFLIFLRRGGQHCFHPFWMLAEFFCSVSLAPLRLSTFFFDRIVNLFISVNTRLDVLNWIVLNCLSVSLQSSLFAVLVSSKGVAWVIKICFILSFKVTFWLDLFQLSFWYRKRCSLSFTCNAPLYLQEFILILLLFLLMIVFFLLFTLLLLLSQICLFLFHFFHFLFQSQLLDLA